MQLLTKDAGLAHLAILTVWFSTDRQKKAETKFDSHYPTAYIFQLSPSGLHHSTSRRENARNFSGGWTLLWVQVTQAGWATSSAPTNNTELLGLGDQSSLSPHWSKATSHPAGTLSVLLGSLTQGAKKGLSLIPHSSAKPVQRHLGGIMWTCLAVNGELNIYCK